jgi:hypothetical protein
MTYANGDCYMDQWILRNEKWLKYGNGIMIRSNGETVNGKWEK